MTRQLTVNVTIKVGRNDPCPCGSGRKYKNCCQGKAPEDFSAGGSLAPHATPPPRAKREAMFDAALRYWKEGRSAQAMALFERLARAEWNNAKTIYHLGMAYLRCARFGDAASLLHRAVELQPSYVDAHIGLAIALGVSGRRSEALNAYRKLSRIVADPVQRRHFAAQALEIEGKSAEAETELRRVLAVSPAHTDSRVLLGQLLQRRGEFDEAQRHLVESLDAAPSGFLFVAKARRMNETDRPLIESMRQRSDGSRMDFASRIHVYFGLGKAFEDLGDYAEAMRHYDLGNRLKAMTVTFDRAAMARQCDAIMARFTADAWAIAEWNPPRPSHSGGSQPVFIVGMPRSGTTLVEQILSSHPEIAAGGELPFWAEHARSPSGPRLDALDPELVAEAVNGYRALLRRIGHKALRVTDKAPGNFYRLGLLMLALPEARVIHCRRNPVATCLSMYFELLEGTWNFAYDRRDLVFAYRQYERLMDHWRRILPAERFTEVTYEAVVSDREAETRRLIDFCGLDWDEACLAPQQNDRSMKTASLWQARQPVYTTSVDRWRRYEPWLGELRELLPGPGTEVGGAADEEPRPRLGEN
jgi:tetratricopeptide (TPR) repeat protein